MRWLKRILIGLAAVVVLLAALAFFLLGTATGGKLALDAIVLPLLPVEVHVDDLSGHLWGDFELIGTELLIPGVEARADRVTVRFRPWALLSKHVELHRVDLDGVSVRIFEPPHPDSLAETPDSARVEGPTDTVPPLMDLPVRITFDSVLANRLSATIMDSIAVTSGRLSLAGSTERFSLAFEGTASDPTIGDLSVAVEGEASPGRMQVASLRVGMLDGTIDGSGEVVWWPDLAWRLDFTGDELGPGTLMEDPAEWPGTVSLSASISGTVDPETGLALESTVDTIAGDLRGERLSGRLSGSFSNGVLDLAESSIVWGPARVRASGSYADAADLEFEASVPDLGLLLPGSSGSVNARGRATGTAEGPRIVAGFRVRSIAVEEGRLAVAGATGNVDVDIAAGPRVVADFEARDLAAEEGRFTVAEADGSIDLDLSARGRLSGSVVARTLDLADEALDSVTAELSGNRPDHRLTIDAVGPTASLRFEATGGLVRDDTWRGTIASLEVAEDSLLGVWTLADSVDVTLSPDSVRLDEVCLLSDPARLCVAGTYDASGADFTAEARGIELVRARPFLPENLAIDAVLQADADLAFPTEGPIVGRVEASTTAGELSLTQDDELRRLYFAPATFVVMATADSLAGSVDVAAADSAGTPLIVLDGELSAPAIEDLGALLERSASTRFELRVADLSLLPFLELGRWDADGSIVATGAFDVDEDRNVSGRLEVDAAPVVLTKALRRGQRQLTFEPARFDLTVDETGMRAELDVEVAKATQPRILVAKAAVNLPGLNRVDADLGAQPVEGHIELTTADLSIAEGAGDMITTAEGNFDLNADLGGTLGDLSVVGRAQLTGGRLVMPDVGLEFTGMQLNAIGSPDGSISVTGEITSGAGRVVIEGSSETGPSPETPTRIAIRGEGFQIMNRPEIQLRVDPDLELVFDGKSTTVTGTIRIPRGRFRFEEIPEGAVRRSSDVVIVSDTIVPPKPKAPVGIDVQLTLGNDIFFRGFGLSARLGGALRIMQEPGGDVRGRGEITLIDGVFRQFGQDLRVEPGRLVFSGPLDQPRIDVRAFVRARDGTEAGLEIGGTPKQLTMDTYSRPQKSQSETMSYILFGRGLEEASGGEGNQANNAAAVLGANVLTMSLAPSVGLDEARIETGSTQDRAQFVLGKYLTPRLYVGYGVGIYQPISTFRIRYLLSSKWSIESMTGDERATDLLYRFEIGKVKTSKDEPGDSESGESASDQSVSGGGS